MKTRLIVGILAVILTVPFSLYTIKKGWGEPYPFFHYKLYSRPDAMNKKVSRIGIYSGALRVNDTDSKLYDKDDLTYILNRLVTDFEQNKPGALYKITLLLHNAYPQYNKFNIVREHFITNDYLHSNSAFSIQPVLTINE